MSRRQHTTLILSVRVPVPVGKTQAFVLNDVTETLKSALNSAYAKQELLVKIEKRETVYL
jgi:hypothetical protein